MRLGWLSICSCLSGIILVVSCDLTDPSRIDRPTMLKGYSPEAAEVTTFLGDTLRFSISAADPDGEAILYCFLLGDSLVSNASRWEYVVEDTGLVSVTATATDGGRPVEVVWGVERLKPENLQPVIKFYEPPVDNPVVIIGNELSFTILAEDPEGMPLNYFYKIADSVVSTSRHYVFEATSVGGVVVTAFVTDGERFTSKPWAVTVTDHPDSIPPAQVEILSLETGVDPGELILRWIAVGEDSMEGIPSHYTVRTSSVPIINEFTWYRASDRPGEPTPASPGEVQMMVVRELIPADFVYVAIRAVDEFGNISPLSATPGAWAKGLEIYGIVRGAVTDAPLQGIKLGIGVKECFTGANGWFEFLELPPHSGEIIIRDEDVDVDYGAYFDFRKPYTVNHLDTLYFWLLPNLQLDTQLYPEFLSFFTQMTDTYNHPFGNILRTWEIPVDVYVPPYVHASGLDYQAIIKGIFDEYEALGGMDFFRFVGSAPAVGVRVTYRDDITADRYEVEEWTPGMKLPVKGLITFRKVYTAANPVVFEKVIRHEVGHALGMKHSLDDNHIMRGGSEIPKVTYVSQDEWKLIFAMYHFPRGLFVPWLELN